MLNTSARKSLQKKAQESHQTWIQAFDTEGPFISVPVAKKTWGDVVPRLSAEAHEGFRLRFADFVKAYDALDLARLGALTGLSSAADRLKSHQSLFRGIQTEWVSFVLRDLAKWGDRLDVFAAPLPEYAAHSPNGAVTTFATGRLLREGKPHALLLTVDPVDSLRQDGKDGWSANFVDRMGEMLRAAEIACGIVTDGRWWSVVWADTRKNSSRVSTIGSGIIDALNWASDLLARDAYINLVSLKTLSGADESSRLDVLIADSLLDAEQITESLGTQVRGAVELLVQAFSESSRNARKLGLPDPLPAETHNAYEAAVTVMMRVVFLLFAEERGLMPAGEMYRTAYSVAGLLDELEERRRYDGDESLERTEVWHRLLAVSAALYEGASFDDVRMPAYGGSLFDPERFPWMEGTGRIGLPIRISDRVMLKVLRSVQYAVTGSGRTATEQKLSFRDIDVEQIGYIYEGLLGYTAARVPEGEIVLGIVGKAGSEPEITLNKLEELYLASDGDDSTLAKKLIDFWKKTQPGATPKSPAQLAKTLSEIDAAQNAEVDLKIRHLVEDDKLRQQIASWGNLIRRDLRGIPYVVPEGGLILEETKSRANAGAHYTPRSLAEEVVLHALQPLCYEPGPLQTADSTLWKLKSSTEILNLRIADIAVGSGAFLVAGARYLGERLLEAWQQESAASGDTSGRDLNLAIREVVSQCLYGADINEMAVEMCKLSLWLVSLDPKKPFSFVDDKVLHGNSLLGLTELKQLRGLHINPSAVRLQNPGFTVDVERPLEKAADIRAKLATPIADQAERDPQRSAKHKKALLAESKAITARLRTIADGIVAAGLKVGGKPGAALNAAYENLSLALLKAYPNVSADANPSMLESIIRAGLTPTVDTDYDRWKPLHWVVEVPDVMIGHGGFDAVVGNPPFLGSHKLSGAVGDNVRSWFVHQLADSRRGIADLVAYFLLRAHRLLRPHAGHLGLIATNSVAQGDTQKVGLAAMIEDGLTIRRAVQSAPWPSSGASLEFAAIWGTLDMVGEAATTSANGVVGPVSPQLVVAGRVAGPPKRLASNRNEAFIGSYVLGSGFVLTRSEYQEMLHEDPRNIEVLFPLLNGEDLNTDPLQQSARYVINFGERSVEESAKYYMPFERVERLVRPEREKINDVSGRRYWWKFMRTRPALYGLIRDLEYVLAIALTSKTVMPVRVPTGQVFSHAIGVFASDSFALMAVLSWQVHQVWAIEFGSSMKNDTRYTPSDVYETFPKPVFDEYLEVAGKSLNTCRSEILSRRNMGLTKFYNLVNDPNVLNDRDVETLRRLHKDLDDLVLKAYGWSDIELNYGFHSNRKVERWTICPQARREVLDRLLEENHRQASRETETGATAGSTRTGGAKRNVQFQPAQEKMF